MKRLLILCISTLLMSACSDSFLNIPPQSDSTEGNFFKTEDHYVQAINNAYASLRDLLNEKGFGMTEMRSDNTHYTRYEAARGYPGVDLENLADFTVAVQNMYARDMWKSCYVGISKTNTILDRIEKTSFSDTFKKKIVGEAKFIRAYLYFQMVQFYGGVPLQLHEVTDAIDNDLPRSTIEEVYKAIVGDVQEAIASLEPTRFPQTGAATQGAARMLYAKVLMTKPDRDYAEAERQLLEITKMGYDLEKEFSDVFDPAKKNGKEHIFSIQFQQGEQGQQSRWLYWFVPRTANADIITGVKGSNVMESSGWNVPTPAMIDLFVDGDKRRDVSVGIAVTNGKDTYTKLDNWFFVGDPRIKDYDIAIPFIRKYHHPHIKIFNTDDNWPVYRYADALLLLAECALELKRPTDATSYVNLVRTRAGLPELKGAITAEIVAAERRLELAFEGHRWFDLVRTGKAVETMTAYGKYIKTIDPKVPSYSYNIKPGYLVYPIPYLEMERNKNLKQNEAYIN